tara:strand:+ start:577 stop:2553 length:1977 start_codon:yes stop_codon:yes gene_type:complete
MATQTATVEVKLTANQQNLKRGLDSAQKSLGKTAKAGKKAQKDLASGGKGVQDSFRRASQSIAAIQGPLGPVAGRITSLGTIIGNVGLKVAAITVGIAALTFGLRAIVGTVSRAEVQFAKLNAILRATGDASGLTITEIEELSREIGIQTLASTQKVRDAAGILLTFKSITGDTFRNALRLTQDLAQVGFGDVKQGAIQLGKALEEPIVGLGALRRVGVSFTEEQKKLIKSLENTGQRAKAQDLILGALNKQVGGAGVKSAQGLAGALDSVSEKFTIFIEKSKIGRAVVDFLTAAMNKLADSMGDAMQDAEALSGKMEIINRILLTQEKIAQRNKELEDSMFFEFNVGDDSELVKLEEQLASLEDRLRVVNAIEKDNIETQKKEAEMYDFTNENVEQKNNALEKAKKVMDEVNRKSEFARKIMFMTNKERKAELEFEKIAAQIRKDVPDETIQAEAIAKARKEHFKDLQNISEETIRFEKIQKAVNDVTGIATKQFDDLSKNLAKAFVTGSTEALNFKNILQSLAQDLVKMTLDLLIFNQIKEGLTTIGGNIGDIIAGPKKKATGGAVSSKMPTLVGERGPELFVPNQAGRIIPSSLTPNAMGGGNGVVVNQNLNFSTGISNTVKAEILTLMPQIQNQTISAVAEARMRGGKFAKAFK